MKSLETISGAQKKERHISALMAGYFCVWREKMERARKRTDRPTDEREVGQLNDRVSDTKARKLKKRDLCKEQAKVAIVSQLASQSSILTRRLTTDVVKEAFLLRLNVNREEH